MKLNKILRPLISTTITFIIIIGIFCVFKGPNFILAKYYYYNGYSRHQKGDFQGAIDDYDKVLNYDKSNTVTYISRGSAYADLEKYKEAIVDYTEAIRQTPNDKRPYAYRGKAFYELTDYTNALKDFNKAIALDDKFGYAYLNRAHLRYTKIKDPIGGCSDLKVALKLGMVEAEELLQYCK